MAINACTINSFTINSLCREARARIIQELPHDIVTKTHPNKINVSNISNAELRNYIALRRREQEEHDFAEMEQLQLSITISAFGETVTSVFENSPEPIVPLIAINKLSFTDLDIKVDDVSNIIISYRE